MLVVQRWLAVTLGEAGARKISGTDMVPKAAKSRGYLKREASDGEVAVKGMSGAGRSHEGVEKLRVRDGTETCPLAVCMLRAPNVWPL